MQMRGLLAFDKPIFRTCDDGYRHPQQPVLFLESACRRNHESRIQQHWLGFGTGAQPFPLETLRIFLGPGWAQKFCGEATATSLCSPEEIWCDSKGRPSAVWPAAIGSPHQLARWDNNSPRLEPGPGPLADISCARANATNVPQECPSTIARGTPICFSAAAMRSACASGVQIVLRGRSLWPKPGRSIAITRYFLAARSIKPLD